MKYIKSSLMFLGAFAFTGVLFLTYQLYFNSDVFIKDSSNYNKSKNIEVEEELFKNEYIYIDEENINSCQNYQNNFDYLKTELKNVFLNSREVTSFLYYDISTGYTYSYNDNVEIPTASSIKAALAIYIFDQASLGKVSLDKQLTYTSTFYSDRSVIFKNKKVDTKYTIKQLVEYSIINSDNTAYLMLLNEFNYKNVQAYWFNLGTTTTYKRSASWGTMTVKDGLIYMKRLYQFYRENDEYGPMLMSIFKKALFRHVDGPSLEKIEIAHKSGYTEEAANDLDIIFDKNPFIFIVLTKKNGLASNKTFFTNATENAYKLHRYYWDNIKCKY
jgi:hypothetical protein